MRRTGVWLSMALAVAPSCVLAEGCVSGVGVVGTRHAGSLAIGEVVFVNTYPSIKACNESMAEASKNPFAHSAPEGSAPFASFTFVCKLPTDCSPPDVGQVQPFHKVLVWAK